MIYLGSRESGGRIPPPRPFLVLPSSIYFRIGPIPPKEDIMRGRDWPRFSFVNLGHLGKPEGDSATSCFRLCLPGRERKGHESVSRYMGCCSLCCSFWICVRAGAGCSTTTSSSASGASSDDLSWNGACGWIDRS